MALQDNPIRSIYVAADVSSGTLGPGGLIDVLLSGTGTSPRKQALVPPLDFSERSANSANWKEIYVGGEFWGVSNEDVVRGNPTVPPTNPVALGELDENLAAGDATITVDDGTGFSASGVIIIEDEIIKYTGKSTNDLTGCTRGYFDTSDVQHDGTASTINIYEWHSGEVLSILYEAEPKVYGIRVKILDTIVWTGTGLQGNPYTKTETYGTFRFEIPEESVTMVLYDDTEDLVTVTTI